MKLFKFLLLVGIVGVIGYVLSKKTSPDQRKQVTQSTGSILSRIFNKKFEILNKYVYWHKLPFPLGVLNLIAIRNILRERNLHDTEKLTPAEGPVADPNMLYSRTPDGSYNDLEYPGMGRANARFARNVPIQYTFPDKGADLMEPSPRKVSLELLTRDPFIPVRPLNVLAAAWLQFNVHDWFNHGPNVPENPIEIPLEEGDPWHENPMRIQRTRPDPTRSPAESNLAPTFLSTAVHWWDGSQIYGSSMDVMQKLRSGENGKLLVSDDGLLPVDSETGVDITGFNDNWWVGLSIMHNLFTMEHNSICDRLKADYPTWSDDELFLRARLINGALIAKIHTVEWTPGILNTPVLKFAMRGNWWGALGEQIYRRFGRFGRGDILSGIVGSTADHHTGIYAMTEEFNAVYRMHPLVPDDYSFRSVEGNRPIQENTFPEIAFGNARKVIDKISMRDAIYSFGTSNPGAITLHNFPRFLQRLETPDGLIVDTGAIDIMRDRERGVPRYNEFRRQLHMPEIESFEEITSNPEWAEQIRSVYKNDLERVDTMVGLLAETPPVGFGFSDTAFRIFALMASRRLKSDRFFTDYYSADVYTPAGMDWIDNNTMSTVLLRHFPELAPVVNRVGNAFAAWPIT